MNAERLHAILIALQTEMAEQSLVVKMQKMVRSLEAVVNQSNSMTQQTLAASLEDLSSALATSESDNFGPTWRQVLREIGGEDFLGNKLRKYVETTIGSNQLTPAVALKEFSGRLSELEGFESAVNSCVTAFRAFNVGDEKLEPGECEIGILVPREAVSNQLLDFAEELKEMGFILNSLSEVATGKKDDLAIRNISSSGLLVFLKAAAPYGACVAFCIERVVTVYKQLLEIRRLRQEIQRQGVPDDATAGIERHANRKMEDEIENITVEVIEKFHKNEDKARKNELSNAVRISLKRIASRIDNGYNLEVRVGLEPQEESQGEDEELNAAIAAIRSASSAMQFLKLEGQPILKLSDGNEKAEKEKAKGKPEKEK